MKVLFINSFFSVGGPPRIVKGLCDTLIANNHQCAVAASREQPLDGPDIIRIGGKYGVYFNALRSRLFDREGFCAKHSTEKLIKQIEQYNPDIIHLHNLHGYYINIETLFGYLKNAGKPVVWTLHDCWSMTGHCAHFDHIGCGKWENTGCYDCPQIKEYPQSMFADNSKSNWIRKKNAFTGVDSLTVVAPSKWLADIAKRSYLGKYQIQTIANGIDLNIFKPAESDFKKIHGIENKKVVLGVAQNWGEKKGLYDFIKLSEALDDTYQIVLVGLTANQMSELPESIIGITRTESSQQLCEIYTAADVFVNPTYQDTFPTVNLEALACGTPVITYATGGSVEAVNDRCGTVVKPGDIEGLADAVRAARFDSSECIHRAAEFEKEKKYVEYIELYKKLLK